MGIAVGTYDRRITIQQPVYSQSNSGEPVITWEDLATNIPARYIPQTGGESVESEQRVASDIVTFHIRHPRTAFTVAANMQVVYNGNHYNITALREVGRLVALELNCVTKDNQ